MITNDIAPVHDVRTELIRLREEALGDGRELDVLALTHAIAYLHRLLPMEQREVDGIPASNQIFAYLHCRGCVTELMALAKEQGSAKPRLFTRYELGWTKIGLQARCIRHELNIVSIDFEGQTHPANTNGTD